MAKTRIKPTIKARPPAKTVTVAFIHPGTVSAYFATSMMAMLLHDQHGPRHITGLLNEWSSANVSASRNTLAATFLDEKTSDWLLFIDADMAWQHDALDQLLATADPAKAPVVGGLCFGASQDRLWPTIYQIAQADGRLKTVRADTYERDAMIQVAATGAAFLLIHRSVLEEIRRRKYNAAFPFFQESEMDGEPVGEDLTFCLRAGNADFSVWVNTGVKVGHHKSHLLTEELFDSQAKDDQ